MVQEMTEKELITVTIDNYMNLQRIKQANGDTVNKELDYQGACSQAVQSWC